MGDQGGLDIRHQALTESLSPLDVLKKKLSGMNLQSPTLGRHHGQQFGGAATKETRLSSPSHLAANIPSQGLVYAMADSVNYTGDQYEARYSKT